MNKLILSLYGVCLLCSLDAQTILVEPYLQDAEPTAIKILWETDGGVNHTIVWGTDSGNLNATVAASSVSTSGGNVLHTSAIENLTANT